MIITLSSFAPAGTGTLKPLRTESLPVIDGKLDDSVWQNAPSVTGFKTWTPDYGRAMAEDTKVYFAYDRKNLYFAFEAFDSQPSRVKASIAARDTILQDDWVAINLDSFADQQSLYAFYVNPLGIQADTRYAAGKEDISADVVWYSAGTINDRGYCVEVRIPLKSIRFASQNPVRMALIFERRISRYSEFGTYPALDPQKGQNWLIQTMPIEYPDVDPYSLLEVLPAVTYLRHSSLREGRLRAEKEGLAAGVSAKYGLTSDLILDGAINPDFSQVESDAGQIDINLRSPLFFPEKRPFFLEGADYFNFAGPSAEYFLRSIVHTRSILDPLAGIKLTGHLGPKNSIGSIYAYDEQPSDPSVSDNAHFAIFRYKRALRQDSYLGGFYTAKERERGHNRVAGTDGLFRLSQASTLGFHAFLSRTEDSPQSPAATGHAVGVQYLHGTRDYDMNFTALDISTDFRVDTGYMTRTGLATLQGAVGRNLYPEKGVVKKITPGVFVSLTNDKPSNQWESTAFPALTLTLLKSTRLYARYEFASEIYNGKKFDTDGIDVAGRSQLTKMFFLSLSYRYGGGIFYAADPYQGKRHDLSAGITCQASDKFRSDLNFTYSDFHRKSDSKEVYTYGIVRTRNTYQVNRYLFVRGILEYNSYWKRWLTDFLASFTYIPGTVIHLGYGSLFEKIRWDGTDYVPSDNYKESRRGLFFKASYLWRL